MDNFDDDLSQKQKEFVESLEKIPGFFFSPVIGLLITESLLEHPSRIIKLNSNIKFLIMKNYLLLSCFNVLPEFNNTSND